MNKGSQCRRGKTTVKVDDEFEMSRQHAPTRRQKDSSSQGPYNDCACGRQHVGVVSLVPADAAPGSARNRQGGLVRAADQTISRAELVKRCPLTTRHLVKRMQRRLQETGVTRVADVATCTMSSQLITGQESIFRI